MPHLSPTVNFRLYFWTSGLTALLLLIAIVTLTYLVDPYFIHQWDTELINRRSPAQQKVTPWAKTYAVYRYQPDVVFLGSSRVEIGLPTNIDLFPGKKVFNLAVQGGTFGDAIAMLNHTSFFHRPEIVVWGLEFGPLFIEEIGNTDFQKTLVAKGPLYPLRRTWMNIKRSLSMDMTRDALEILMGISEQACQSILATYGHKSAECVEQIMTEDGGTAKAFDTAMQPSDLTTPTPDFRPAMQQLDQVAQDFCQSGTVFRFYIHPIHALNQLYWETRGGKDIENWKRELVKVVDKHKQQGCDIRLMDFSGFNTITTEDIPQATGKETMQNYWEQSHYRDKVGAKILTRLFSATPQTEPNDFGVELNGGVIEQHLNNQRKSREAYCTSHPRETAQLQGGVKRKE